MRRSPCQVHKKTQTADKVCEMSLSSGTYQNSYLTVTQARTHIHNLKGLSVAVRAPSKNTFKNHLQYIFRSWRQADDFVPVNRTSSCHAVLQLLYSRLGPIHLMSLPITTGPQKLGTHCPQVDKKHLSYTKMSLINKSPSFIVLTTLSRVLLLLVFMYTYYHEGTLTAALFRQSITGWDSIIQGRVFHNMATQPVISAE